MVNGVSNMLKLISCGTRPMQDLAASSSLVDVVTEHLDHAAGFVDQRGGDADGGGFAGAVRAEQREKIAFIDFQVDGFKRFNAVFIDFGELSED